MTRRFHLIEDSSVIVHHKGVYRQEKVYQRGADLYASRGPGFIRLVSSSRTSYPHASWSDLDIDKIKAAPDRLGYMQIVDDPR